MFSPTSHLRCFKSCTSSSCLHMKACKFKARLCHKCPQRPWKLSKSLAAIGRCHPFPPILSLLTHEDTDPSSSHFVWHLVPWNCDDTGELHRLLQPIQSTSLKQGAKTPIPKYVDPIYADTKSQWDSNIVRCSLRHLDTYLSLLQS